MSEGQCCHNVCSARLLPSRSAAMLVTKTDRNFSAAWLMVNRRSSAGHACVAQESSG